MTPPPRRRSRPLLRTPAVAPPLRLLLFPDPSSGPWTLACGVVLKPDPGPWRKMVFLDVSLSRPPAGRGPGIAVTVASAPRYAPASWSRKYPAFREDYSAMPNSAGHALFDPSEVLHRIAGAASSLSVPLPPHSAVLALLEDARRDALREAVAHACRLAVSLGLPSSDCVEVASSLLCEEVMSS